jgi:hypothetical protein
MQKTERRMTAGEAKIDHLLICEHLRSPVANYFPLSQSKQKPPIENNRRFV